MRDSVKGSRNKCGFTILVEVTVVSNTRVSTYNRAEIHLPEIGDRIAHAVSGCKAWGSSTMSGVGCV